MLLQQRAIDHFYESIHGWSDGIDKVYNRIIKKSLEPRVYRFVEVGTWRGRSAAYMAVEIARSGKMIDFYCVDTWKGSLDEELHQKDPAVIQGRLYEEFLENMKPVVGYFNPIKMPSIEAAKLFVDHSLDFVFIDAQHDYDSVYNDITSWLPKIRYGGTIAGHDYCNGAFNGVSRAVNSIFSNFEYGNGCWIKEVNADLIM